MISKASIELILETARVEDVIGDYISLKKRGANLLGNCPFHNEKTPSFTVSPTKGIYKCFGCGKAGNSVNFIMEHEHYSYPEALKYLAKKYNISVEEDEHSFEEKAADNERESLYIVSGFAQKFYTENIHTNQEGIAVGLSYFKERGFRQDIIEKFQLGYSLNEWAALTDKAKKEGYNVEYLEKTGLTIRSDEKIYDRFRGRVMFPIHNLTGRVIGFGGRILKADPKSPKYVNSPETDIYHKSKVLYGAYFAKKAIIAEDNCFLVEGYTDVISMHQAGVENVVASSGTSLTVEQIRLIGRYTKNITVLYDGDAAGIKASIRGIDLILEEGLNVKVALFPDGEDPDSYSKKVSSDEFKSFIKKQAKDFISFKTKLLLSEVEGDPIKKAGLIKDIVATISKIPDPIIRSTYVKECSNLLEINEPILIAELNKIRRSSLKKQIGEEVEDIPTPELKFEPQPVQTEKNAEFQERDIIRLLLAHADKQLTFYDNADPRDIKEIHMSVAEFILNEMKVEKDFLAFNHAGYQKLIDEYFLQAEKEVIPDQKHFINHSDPEINKVAVDLLTFPYELSENWERHEIHVITEEKVLKQAVLTSLYALKMRKLMLMIYENQEKLKTVANDDEMMDLLLFQQQLESVKKELSKELGVVVVK